MNVLRKLFFKKPPSKTDGSPPAESIKCEGCGAIYSLGADAVSITAEELTKMMPGLIGKLPQLLMVGHSTGSDKRQLENDRMDILRFGPKGWICKACHKENRWLLDGNSIVIAARFGDLEIVRWLLEKNPNLAKATNSERSTPLHKAASYDQQETAELLLKYKPDVNATDSKGYTPLHDAAMSGHRRIVELLLASGGDLKAKTSGGLTPLHAAIYMENKDIAALLLSKGAEIDKNDTALHLAMMTMMKKE